MEIFRFLNMIMKENLLKGIKMECDKSICPKCKAEIDHLNFDVTGSCSAQVYEDNPNNIDYDLSCLTDGVIKDNFRCPECGETLFNSETEAIEFLKK